MSQYAYILVVISLLFLFLVNKYEKEKLQRLLQDQLLKDPAFRATIKEKIQTIENINDVIDYINKGYRLGIPISKEIVDEIRKS
ncbi:MarR family transcriptional regulator [Streptococcus sp. Z554]